MGRSTVASLVVALAAPLITTIGTPSTAAAVANEVVINEIMYHPEDDRPDGEFIELYNRGSASVDLSGWCIDGVKFCFPVGTSIGGDEHLVTRSSEWDGGLKNGGEDIALRDAGGIAIDAVEYDDKGQWPANTDGNGASLQRIDANSSAQNAGNWWGAAATPGRRNARVAAPMRLAVVRFDASGSACIFTSVATHVLADLQGYLADGAIDDVDDVRLLDTRGGVKPAGGSETVISGRPGESAVVSVVAGADVGAWVRAGVAVWFGAGWVVECEFGSGGSERVESGGGAFRCRWPVERLA